MINHTPKEVAPKLWIEAVIFMTAYYPLFMILMINDIRQSEEALKIGSLSDGYYISYWAVGLFLASSISSLLSAYIMRRNLTYQEGGLAINILSCDQLRGDMLNYTLPFLVGMFALDYQSWQSVTSLLVFLLFMFAFTRKDRGILLNPMFLLMGIRLYNIEYKKIGGDASFNKTALCLGDAQPSDVTIYTKQTVGIEFIYPEKIRNNNA